MSPRNQGPFRISRGEAIARTLRNRSRSAEARALSPVLDFSDVRAVPSSDALESRTVEFKWEGFRGERLGDFVFLGFHLFQALRVVPLAHRSHTRFVAGNDLAILRKADTRSGIVGDTRRSAWSDQKAGGRAGSPGTETVPLMRRASVPGGATRGDGGAPLLDPQVTRSWPGAPRNRHELQGLSHPGLWHMPLIQHSNEPAREQASHLCWVSSHFSQSIAAAQPEPAAVMAWR